MRKVDFKESEWVTPEIVYKNIVKLNNICFEVTDKCNLACHYCVYRDLFVDHDDRVGLQLSFDKVRVLLEYLFEIWDSNPLSRKRQMRTISFYGGEPLLNFSLIRDVVEYLEVSNRNLHFRYNMTTNGMLLDQYMDYLVDKQFHLLVSLDGDFSENGHRVLHDGSSSFNRVFANVKLLQTKYPDYFKKFVDFNSVLSNLNDVSDLISFFQKEYGKTPSISEINPRGLDDCKIDTYRVMYKNFSDSIESAADSEKITSLLFMNSPIVRELYDYIKLEGDYYYDYIDLLRPKSLKFMPCAGSCTPFGRKMFITVRGKILSCERIGQENYLGVVNKDSVDLDYRKVANSFNALIQGVASQCSTCAGKEICNKCVYYVKRNLSGVLECDSYLTSEKLSKWKDSCRDYIRNHPELYKRIIDDAYCV